VHSCVLARAARGRAAQENHRARGLSLRRLPWPPPSRPLARWRSRQPRLAYLGMAQARPHLARPHLPPSLRWRVSPAARLARGP
jgi:hypothetical protein